MNHLDNTQVQTLLSGTLPQKTSLALMEHIAGCDDCAARLWAANEALPSAPAPAGLQARVLERAHAKPPQESLRSYALRVIAAMAAALVLLFSGMFQKITQLDLPQLNNSIRTQVSAFIDSTKEGLSLTAEATTENQDTNPNVKLKKEGFSLASESK